jgi:hypothetical protein
MFFEIKVSFKTTSCLILTEMRQISFANAGCILCIIVVLGCQATVGKLEDDETSQPLRLGFAQE